MVPVLRSCMHNVTLWLSVFVIIGVPGMSEAEAAQVYAIRLKNGDMYSNDIVTYETSNPQDISLVGSTGLQPDNYIGTGLDFDSQGRLYLSVRSTSSPSFLFDIDPRSGQATNGRGFGLAPDYSIMDLSWDDSGQRLLGIAGRNNVDPGATQSPHLYSIDTGTGQAHLVSILTTLPDNQPVGLSVDSYGMIYVLGMATKQWWRVDPTEFQASPFVTIPTTTNLIGLNQGGTIDRTDNDVLLWSAYLNSPRQAALFRIDTRTGALDSSGAIGAVSSLFGDIAIAPIPEPASWLLLGQAVVSAALWNRYRRRRQERDTSTFR